MRRELKQGFSRLGTLGFAVAALLFVFLTALPTRTFAQAAEETYKHKCAVCHGADGKADTTQGKKYKVKDVRVQIKQFSEDDMIKVVQNGKGANMDSFSDELSPAQIKAVVEYYRSLAKSK